MGNSTLWKGCSKSAAKATESRKPTPFFLSLSSPLLPQNFYTAPYLERGQEESSPIGINGHSTPERKKGHKTFLAFWPSNKMAFLNCTKMTMMIDFRSKAKTPVWNLLKTLSKNPRTSDALTTLTKLFLPLIFLLARLENWRKFQSSSRLVCLPQFAGRS